MTKVPQGVLELTISPEALLLLVLPEFGARYLKYPRNIKHDAGRDEGDRRILGLPKDCRRHLLPRWM